MSSSNRGKYSRLESKDTGFVAGVTNADEQNRRLSDDAAEFKIKYEFYNKQYKAMMEFATVSARDKFTPKEKEDRLNEAKQIFKSFLIESDELARLFRLKFRIERALYNRVHDEPHIKGLDGSEIKFIMFNVAGNAYYDALKKRIKNEDTDPLILSIYGLFHAWLHFEKTRDRYSTGEELSKARSSLVLAWVLTENNFLLKSEIESLYDIVTPFSPKTLADFIMQKGRDAYPVLLEYPPAQRQEVSDKLANAQAELRAMNVRRQQQSVVPNSVFSANTSTRLNNNDAAVLTREAPGRK